jgi:hypothetical protein
LGITLSTAKEFLRFKPQKDRVRLLKYAMKKIPLMRIRGYGSRVSFQFSSPESDPRPYLTIKRWIQRWGGPVLLLQVTNFSTKRTARVLASDWETFMYDEVLSKRSSKRHAKTPIKTALFGKPTGVKKNGR